MKAKKQKMKLTSRVEAWANSKTLNQVDEKNKVNPHSNHWHRKPGSNKK